MLTYDDLLWLIREGLLRLEAHYDWQKEQPYINCHWYEAALQDVMEAHKTDLFILARKEALKAEGRVLE